MSGALQSLVVMLDRAGPSFCYYGPPRADGGEPAPAEPMSAAVFERVLDYAEETGSP